MKKTAIFVISAMILLSSSALFAHEGHKAEHKHPYPTAPFDLNRGKTLYKQYCASCHGVSGDGQGPAANSLNPKPTNFLDMSYMSMRSRVDHFESINNGRPGTTMSPWKGTLSVKDIWNIIAYIEHLFNHQPAATKDHKTH